MNYNENNTIIFLFTSIILVVISIFSFIKYQTPVETKYITNVTVQPIYIYIEQPELQPAPTPPPEPPLSEDTKLVARIINAEASTQPYEGKIAVGNVILNRVASPKFPDTIKDVIFQKGQFSPVSDGSINKEPNPESVQAAKDVMNGKRTIGTDALFYYNPNICTNRWIFTRRTITKIGDHVFAM